MATTSRILTILTNPYDSKESRYPTPWLDTSAPAPPPLPPRAADLPAARQRELLEIGYILATKMPAAEKAALQHWQNAVRIDRAAERGVEQRDARRARRS